MSHDTSDRALPWFDYARALHDYKLERLQDMMMSGDDQAGEEILRRARTDHLIGDHVLQTVAVNCPDLRPDVSTILASRVRRSWQLLMFA